MKKHSLLLSVLILSGCASDPVVQVQVRPQTFVAPMSATALRTPATADGVSVPAHNAQGLISGLEPLPVEPLVAQEGFWIVANDAPVVSPVVQEKDIDIRPKTPVKKVVHKPAKKPVKYVCKPAKGSS